MVQTNIEDRMNQRLRNTFNTILMGSMIVLAIVGSHIALDRNFPVIVEQTTDSTNIRVNCTGKGQAQLVDSYQIEGDILSYKLSGNNTEVIAHMANCRIIIENK
ncbi:hypothetical protein [uncultured Shewanella sp.]|uniref:hypothetical protein n=1 Tax=Shewanella atlantica TaxID=271099 RepID=UPI0026343899|nr:hypothetical protein [uncultured Shewanella sp.]